MKVKDIDVKFIYSRMRDRTKLVAIEFIEDALSSKDSAELMRKFNVDESIYGGYLRASELASSILSYGNLYDWDVSRFSEEQLNYLRFVLVCNLEDDSGWLDFLDFPPSFFEEIGISGDNDADRILSILATPEIAIDRLKR